MTDLNSIFTNIDPSIILSNEIITLVVFNKTGSMTKTARALNMSQPAVTKRIKKFEEQIGISLIADNDTGRGYILNDNGKLIADSFEISAGHFITDVNDIELINTTATSYQRLSRQAKDKVLQEARSDLTDREIEMIVESRKYLYSNTGSITIREPMIEALNARNEGTIL